MDNLQLSKIKTKNLKKDKVIVKPTSIPLMVEKEFYSQIRAYNFNFKQAVRAFIFPLIESYSKITRDSITKDGIGDDINNALVILKAKFDFNSQAERISKNMVNRVSILNGKKTIERVNNAIGVDVANIINSENLTEFVEMQQIQNSELIKSVPNQAIEDIRRIVLNGLTNGLRADEITQQISGNIPSSVFNKMNNRIKTIARTEVAKLNSQMTNRRLTNLGITRAIWDATMDKRTRACHAARDGQEFDINEGLYSSCDGLTIKPGQTYNCRCISRPIIE